MKTDAPRLSWTEYIRRNEKLAPRQSTFTHRVDDLKIRSISRGKNSIVRKDVLSFFLSISLDALPFPPFALLSHIPFGFIGIRRSLSRGSTLFPYTRVIVDAGWKLADQWSCSTGADLNAIYRDERIIGTRFEKSGKSICPRGKESQRIIGHRFFSRCWGESDRMEYRLFHQIVY